MLLSGENSGLVMKWLWVQIPCSGSSNLCPLTQSCSLGGLDSVSSPLGERKCATGWYTLKILWQSCSLGVADSAVGSPLGEIKSATDGHIFKFPWQSCSLGVVD